MEITLSPELQRRIAEKVERGGVGTADTLVEQALKFYLDYEGVVVQFEFAPLPHSWYATRARWFRNTMTAGGRRSLLLLRRASDGSSHGHPPSNLP